MARHVAQSAYTGAPAGATVEFKVHFRIGTGGRRRLRTGATPKPRAVEPGRIPRISRLMALAIHFDKLIRQGDVRDYADLAKLGGISRSRVSQIMDLLNLAPEIQEEILSLPRVTHGDQVTERSLRLLVTVVEWSEQLRMWHTAPRVYTCARDRGTRI